MSAWNLNFICFQLILFYYHSSRPVAVDRDEPEDFPAPKFTIDLNSVSIKEGHDANFACKVEPTSDSNLEVEWLRNGVPIAAGKSSLNLDFKKSLNCQI